MANGHGEVVNATKGFDFIQPDGGGQDVFVHISAVERAGMSDLREGEKLSFDLEDDRKGSGKKSAANLKQMTALPPGGPASINLRSGSFALRFVSAGSARIAASCCVSDGNRSR